MHALLLTLLLAAAGPVEVQMLDGTTVAGSLVQLDTDRAVIDTADGPVECQASTLLSIRPKAHEKSSAGNSGTDLENMAIHLVDGSVLTARQYTVGDAKARVTLLDGQVIEIAANQIAQVRLQPQGVDTAQPWAELAQNQRPGDLLVIRKGDTIDHLEGVIHDVDDERVHFELDGETLPVKRSKAFGLIYRRAPATGLSKTVCQIVDTSGSRWNVASLSLDGSLDGDTPDENRLRWTTRGGITFTRPLDAIKHLDFSLGKIAFLSDLAPESIRHTPYFGNLAKRPLLANFRAVRNDMNLEAAPLRLGGKSYAKGLALHSRTEVTYRLPDRFRRFLATIGIDDVVRPHGDVRLVIRGDDRVLFEKVVRGTDPPEAIDVDVTGVRRLSILADFGGLLDVADHLDLCEARVLK